MTAYCHLEIDGIVVSSTRALLGPIHVRFLERTHLSPPLEKDSYAAVLGYVGDDIRGALTVVCAKEVLVAMSRDGKDYVHTESELRDWSGELSNRLLGRIKNQLASRDVGFRVATPVTMTAHILQVPPLDASNGDWYGFETESGSFWVRLDLRARLGWELPDLVPETDEEVPDEGEMLLF